MSSPAREDNKLTRLIRWRNGETPGPWQMVVFPTNRCNLKCSICWQRWVEEKWGKIDHSGELSDERLLRLVDEAAHMGVREWTIGGGGDPMIRGELVMRMCARIRERGMNGGIFTNGTLLKREHLEHLVRIGWERLDLSLDGPTAEINDAVRSPGSFDRAVKAMHLLDDIRTATGKTYPIIDVHFVITRLNLEHMDEMVRLVSAFGIKKLGFSLLHVQSEQCMGLQLTEQQWKQLPALAKQAHALAKTMGVDTSAWTVSEAMQRRQARTENTGNTTQDLLASGCFEPFLTATVVSEGYVGPCCAFWDESADKLHHKSLQEIWTGPYLQNIRQRLMARDYPDFCAYCPSHFVWQTEEIRTGLAHAVTQNGPIPIRPFHAKLVQRVVSSIRERGISGTYKRAMEWLVLTLGAQKDRDLQ